MSTLTIYLDDELSDLLAKEAETVDRSKSYIVRKAVKAYLENNSIVQEFNQL
jgi:predicted transcriptional regulator